MLWVLRESAFKVLEQERLHSGRVNISCGTSPFGCIWEDLHQCTNVMSGVKADGVFSGQRHHLLAPPCSPEEYYPNISVIQHHYSRICEWKEQKLWLLQKPPGTGCSWKKMSWLVLPRAPEVISMISSLVLRDRILFPVTQQEVSEWLELRSVTSGCDCAAVAACAIWLRSAAKHAGRAFRRAIEYSVALAALMWVVLLI